MFPERRAGDLRKQQNSVNMLWGWLCPNHNIPYQAAFE